MASKDLFIHTINQVEVDANKNIPTALHYRSESDYVIGYDALSATTDVLNVNQDFKVDLGRHDSTAPKQIQKFPTACGQAKSAYVMTSDFITRVLRQVSQWLTIHQVEEAAHILIAEPLAMQENSDAKWLENYRRNLREILAGRTSEEFPNIRIQEVSFLPEPFAVFQYYRYGINHPLMSQDAKHHALIMDFGGGTFDVCVIQTTKEGFFDVCNGYQ
jgi:molecular chaperone DnaK (HSP70)